MRKAARESFVLLIAISLIALTPLSHQTARAALDSLSNKDFSSALSGNSDTGWRHISGAGAQISGGFLQFQYDRSACGSQATATLGVVQQRVQFSTPGKFIFTVDVDARDANTCYDPYEVTLQRSSDNSIVTSTRYFGAAHAQKTITLEITTTTANEYVTISLMGLDAGYWAGWYGPKFDNASLKFYPAGILENISKSTLASWGWSECWSGTYGGTAQISAVESACNLDSLLYAGGLASSNNFILAAAGPRSTLFSTTNPNATNLSNGVYWYYNSSSMGFAPNSTISQSSADVSDHLDARRISWHRGATTINGGWRVGSVKGLNFDTTYVRAIYELDGIGAVQQVEPLAPTINSISPGNSQLTVAFTSGSDGGSPITKYQYQINGGSWTDRADGQTTSSPLVISGLTNRTTYSVKIRALNSVGNGAESSAVSSTPFAPLTITTPNSGLSATTGSAYSLSIASADGLSPRTFSLLSGALPVGLTLNSSTGEISGTPIEAGNFAIRVRLTDGTSTVDTSSFTIAVSGAAGLSMFVKNQAGTSQGIGLPSAFNTSLCGSGITEQLNYNWGTGRPTVNGSSLSGCNTDGFTVYAKGSITAPVTGVVTFCAVVDDGFYLKINNTEIIRNWVDQGSNANCNSTGTMSMVQGTVYPFEAWLHENGGGAVMQLLWSYTNQSRIAIPSSAFTTGLPALSVITPTSGLTGDRGVSFSLPVVAVGGTGSNTFTIASGTLPAGLSINASTGIISGAPTASGSFPITVTVTPSAGSAVTTNEFTISIGGVPGAPTSPGLTTVDVQGDGRLKASWTAPTDTGGSSITDYQIRYALDGILAWSAWLSVNGIDANASTNRQVTISGLQNARSYVVQVRAVNSSGVGPGSVTSSALAATGVAATNLTAPTSRGIVTGDRQITVNFTENPVTGGAIESSVLFNTISEQCTRDSYWIVRSNVRYAHQFTAGSAATLTKVEWRMGAGLQQYPSQIKIVIYGNGAGDTVGSKLGELLYSSASSNISVYTGNVSLSGAGTYWIEQQPTASIANHYYCGTSSTSSTGSAEGWSQQRGKIANGSNSASWSYFAGTSYFYPMFRITAESSEAARNAITEYQYSLDGGTTWRSVARAALAAGPSLVIPGLTNGTTYDLRLRAVNGAGPGAILNLGTARPGVGPSIPRDKELSLGQSAGQIVVDFKTPSTTGGIPLTYQYRIKESASVPSTPTYYPSGPRENVAVTELTNGGWTLCWSDQFRGVADLSTILNACTGKYITLAAGAANDPNNYLLLAAGERESVFRPTGLNVTTSNNGTLFYYNTSRSMGFAPLNSTIQQSSADVTDRTSRLRMSWHLGHCGTNKICGGWRVGSITGLNSSSAYVRAIYTSAGSQAESDDGWSAWADVPAASVTTTGEDNEFVIPSITNNKTYSVQIRAVNDLGNSAATTAKNIDARRASGPTITTQPTSRELTLNQSAGFTLTVVATATGGEAITYQWYRNGTAIQGATSASYSIAGPITSANRANFDGEYYVAVTGTLNATSGVTNSSTATVVVKDEPVIDATAAPGNGTVGAAYSKQLALVTNKGAAPFTWSLAPGARLPAGLALSSDGRITGTPTTSSTSAAAAPQQISGSDALKNGTFTSPLVSDPTQGWAQTVRSGGNAVISGGGIIFSYGSPSCTNQAAARMGEVQQKVTISNPGTVTFTVKVDARIWNRIGAGYSNPCHDPYQVTLTASGGATQTSGRLFATTNLADSNAATFDQNPANNLWRTITVSVTTTTANEVLTISLFGLDSGYWAGNYGPKFYDATLTVPGGGAPSSNGVTFLVTDANGRTDTETFTISIDPELVITTRTLPNAANGAFYSQTLSAEGGSGTYTWAVVGGDSALPTGLALTTNGVLSGNVGASATSKSFNVTATDGNGAVKTQGLSITVASGLPDVPTNLTVGTLSSQTIPLTWTAPTNTGGSAITQYLISYSAPKGSDPNDTESVDQGLVTVSATGLTFPYNLTGLINGRTYSINVKARNASSTGNASSTVTAKPVALAGPVRNLSASLANGGIAIRWRGPQNAGGNPITSYKVQCRVGEGSWSNITDRVEEAGTEISVVAITGLTIGSSYDCRVAAVTSSGDGEFTTTPSTVTLATPPSAPRGAISGGQIGANITSAIQTPGRMTVTWSASESANGSAITSYIAYVSRDAGSDKEITRSCSVTQDAAKDTSGYSCVVMGIPKKGNFRVYVVAVNAIGTSADKSIDVTEAGDSQTLTIPNSPRAFNTSVSGAAVSIPLGTADFSIGATVNSGLPVQYSVTQATSARCSITNRGLVKLLAVGDCHVVLSQNGQDARGVETDFASITPQTVKINITDRIPGTPRITAVTPSSGKLTITWSAPSNTGGTPTHYEFQVALSNGNYGANPDDDFTVTDGATLTKDLTGLVNGSEYKVRIRSKNSGGVSDWIEHRGNVTVFGVPSAPTIDSVVPTASEGRATVNWTLLTGAATGGSAITGYEVSATAGDTVKNCFVSGTASSCDIYGLDNKVEYTFVLKARNVAGLSSASTQYPATVPGIDQIITSTAPAFEGWTVGGANYQIQASSNSGATLTFTSADTGICTVSSTGSVGFVASGTCAITISQSGSGTRYNAATSVVIRFSITPALPSAPTITSIVNGTTGLTLNWSAPARPGSAISGYTITGNDGQTSVTWSVGNVVTAALTTNLSKGVTYTFTIKATNSAGSGSDSEGVSATWLTVPDAPEIVSVLNDQGDGRAMSVTWDKSVSDGGSAILRYVATATAAGKANVVCQATSTGAARESCVLTNLEPGVAYSVTVLAVNAIGNSVASSATNQTPGISQTLTVTTPTSVPKNFGDAPFRLAASLDSGNTPTFTSSNSAICTVDSTGLVTIIGAGNCEITVGHPGSTQASPSQYKGVTPVVITVAISAVAPSSPTLNSAVIADGTLTIGLTPSASLGGSTLTTYEYSLDNGANWITPNPLVTGSTFSVSVAAGTYTVKVRSKSAANLLSEPSNSIDVATTAPQSPTGVAAIATLVNGNPGLIVSWRAPQTDGGSTITGYTASASTNGASTTCSTNGTTFSCTITGLAAGTAYVVTLTATNAIGPSEPSTSINISTIGKPGAPTSVTASEDVNRGRVTISWTAPVSDGGVAIATYQARAYLGDLNSATSFTCTKPHQNNVTSYSCTISGLNYKVGYVFAVTATNSIATSDPSTATSLVTLIRTQSITFDVTSPITWRTRSLALNARSDSGLAVSYSTTTPGVCTVSGSILTIAGVGTCAVSASQSGENSQFSAAATITREITVQATQPAPTTILSVVPSANELLVSWSNVTELGGSSTKSYLISYATNPEFTDELSITTSNQSITLSGLTPGATYNIRAKVLTSNFEGGSAWSNIAQATVLGVPESPVGVSVTPGAGILTVSWNAVDSAASGGSPILGYRASALLGLGDANPASCTTSGTSCVIGGLDGSAFYTVQIVAINAVGSSEAYEFADDYQPSAEQTISASDTETVNRGIVKKRLAASASSGLPVTYTVTSSSPTEAITGRTVCSVDANTGELTFDLAGTCVVTISQNGRDAGNRASAYKAATNKVVTITVQPDNPGNVLNFDISSGDQKLIVSWAKPTGQNDGGRGLKGYEVIWFATEFSGGNPVSKNDAEVDAKLNAATPTAFRHEITDPNVLSYEVTGLTNGVNYTIIVKSINNANLKSQRS